jgi:L-malate glycosyltransferase
VNDPRIQLAYFSNASARGGAEEHILTLLHGLDRTRFQPYLICSPAVAEKLGKDVPEDVTVIPLRFGKLSEFSGAFRLAKLLRHNRIQILHSHLFYSSLYASPVGWLCGIPAILETPHLRELWREGKAWPKSSFLVDRIVGRCIDGYIAVSKANGAYLRDVKKLPDRKIHVVQNGSDLKRFSPDHQVPAGMRESLGFGAKDPVLLVPARLELQKGHRILFDALPIVLKEFPAVRIVCAGEGALLAELQDQVKRLDLEQNVSFVGRQQKLEDWFALCDFTILPSYFEGLPLVAVESLAAGRPMVATAVDGTPEVILDGKNGLTVPPGDATALATAIIRMLCEPEMRRGMAAAGRRWALECFTQRLQIEKTEALYEALLQAAGAKHSSGSAHVSQRVQDSAKPVAVERSR